MKIEKWIAFPKSRLIRATYLEQKSFKKISSKKSNELPLKIFQPLKQLLDNRKCLQYCETSFK